MNKISEEDLIGYLLGALDPAEERTVEQALEASVELRNQLAFLEDKLTRMPDRFVEVDPPPHLTDKTLNTISIVDASLNQDQVSGAGEQNHTTVNAESQRDFSNGGNRLKPQSQVQPQNQVQDQGGKTKNSKRKLRDGRNELRPGGGSNWSVMDFIVGGVVCFVIAVVLLPSISNSRYQSSLVHCQDNLRNIGYNMASIADSYDGRFVVPQQNDQWQASQFVRAMIEAELSSNTDEFICPSDPGKEKTAEICNQVWSVLTVAPEHEVINPTSPQHSSRYRSSQAQLDCNIMRQTEAACGSYGFPAPQVSNSQIEVIRVPGSPFNVLCADAACFDNPGYLSRNHGGRGQNVLLGDLSVDFICETACLPSGDHIYTNNQGKIQPGVFPGDNLIFRGSMTVEKPVK